MHQDAYLSQVCLQADVLGLEWGADVLYIVCGSAAIAKTCRDALRLPFSTALFGGPSVILHVESFGYA